MLRIAVLFLVILTPLSARAADLVSWNDKPARQAIVEFVTAATTPGGPGYIEPHLRVAVFDNDGTLWAEQPVYFQFMYAIDTAMAMAAKDPAWASTPALQAAAKGDVKGVLAGGEAALLEVVSATHSGMSVPDFTASVALWIATAKHPQTGKLYLEMVYQPMLELLDYLRANGFETYIVSGGGVDFMRAFAEHAYGIPPQNVIGSLGKASLQVIDGVPQIMKDPGIAFIDDKEGKPLGIERGIGKRPVFVAGNSDGDLAMLEWSTAGVGPRFGLLVHHTDGVREYAYDRDSHVGRLDKALDAAAQQGWTVVDMAADWKAIYPGDPLD